MDLMVETIKKERFVDNGNGTVTDFLHNRMWMKDDTWVDLGRIITWHQSQEYAKEMNGKNFGGYSNWHLPTASEAKFLFDYEVINTDVEGAEVHIDPIFTSGCGFTTWTSETRGAKAAMGYDYRSDYEFWLAKENEGFPSSVRLVRTIQKKGLGEDEVRFIVNKNGTIDDNETGLMWKADDSFLDLDKWISWEEAKIFVSELCRKRFAGFSDWRMPTRKEAQSIYDAGNPLTDTYGDIVFIYNAFPPGCGLTCWTRTIKKSDQTLAMRFHFYNGDYKWHKKGLRSHGVRAVRADMK